MVAPPVLIPDLLDSDEAIGIRTEMLTAANQPAWVNGADGAAVATDVRSTKVVSVSAATFALVHARLWSMSPQLAQAFGVPLRSMEAPQFLRYVPGDFFVAHHDRSEPGQGPIEGQRRLVSISLFIAGGGWSGGRLVLYTDDSKRMHWPIAPAAGLGVAFAADTMHEITPITAGERFTVVTWYGD